MTVRVNERSVGTSNRDTMVGLKNIRVRQKAQTFPLFFYRKKGSILTWSFEI